MTEHVKVGVAAYPDLAGRRVVIAGGTGSVGEGIVRGYLRAGAQVVVPTRTRQRLVEFRTVLGEEGESDCLTLLVGDYTTLDGADKLAVRIENELGPVDDVVSAIGGWWAGGPVWEVGQTEWDTYFVGFATAHLAMARTWVPRLPGHGSYQLIAGASAIYPIAGSGIVSMQQAALLMMGKVLQAEADGQRRVFSQLLGVVNNRDRPVQRAEWISAEDVGLIATALSADPAIASRDVRLLDKGDFARVLDELGLSARTGAGA